MAQNEIAQSILNTQTYATLAELKRTPFSRLVDMALKTVSDNSKRVYENTYTSWLKWCESNDIHPIDLLPDNVHLFLSDTQATKTTLSRHLYALRKLAEIASILDGEDARKMYQLLKLMRGVPTPSAETTAERERATRALSPSEAHELLRVWRNGTDTLSRRNYAMIATLLYTGVRRSELVALTWQDVNFENGTITIRHGKGDKNRTISILDGGSNTCLDALKAWQSMQGQRTFIFCSVNKGGSLGKDKPTPDKTVESVVKTTAERANIGNVSPHDLRRTLGTIMAEYTTTTDVQFQLGHANPTTTQTYIKASEAKRRRDKVKLPF